MVTMKQMAAAMVGVTPEHPEFVRCHDGKVWLFMHVISEDSLVYDLVSLAQRLERMQEKTEV